MKAYHFTDGNKLRDGRPLPAIGEWLEHTGVIVPCSSGLHASEHPFDALRYAPGALLHLVEIDGEIQTHGNPVDKVVCRRRKILKTIDATPILREFARWCALQVVHLWDCPEVVRRFLETGYETLRDSARSAARDAAWSAARDAAWSAARDAAWDAALDAALDAARSAAWAAARDAARDAAWDAWDSAWASARAAQRAKFSEIVDSAFAATR